MSRKQTRRSTKRKKATSGKSRRPSTARSRPRSTPTLSSTLLEDGVRQLSTGNIDSARACFEDAVRLDPANAVALNCLGIAHRLLGEHKTAIRMLQNAIAAQPDFAEAHSNLGNAYRDAGQLAEARTSYERSIQLKPSLAEAHNSLGVIHLSQHDIQAAILSFEAALQHKPAYAEAHNNLGNAYRDVGDLTTARDRYSQALQIQPNSAEVYNNLGNVYRDLGDPDAARQAYKQALALQPAFADASENLGTILADAGDYDGSIEAYRRAVALRPDSVDTLIHLGNVHKEQAQLGMAREAYQRAASLEPDNRIHELRAASLCPAVFEDGEAMRTYREQVLRLWKELSQTDLSTNDLMRSASLVEPPFSLQFLDGSLRDLKEAYANIFQHRFPERSPSRPSGKPKVGVVVTKTHEGIFLKSMRGVLDNLSQDIADLTIVCPDASIQQIRNGLNCELSYLPLPHSFAQMEKQIRDARFDVLYYWEIGTDATNYFLPFLRLAPVQCTSWGVQVTTGIGNIDVYLSNEWVEAPDATSHYSEQLIRAKTPLTYQYRDLTPATAHVPSSLRLTGENTLYLCAQQLGKFHTDFDSTLAEILRRDPKGVIIAIDDKNGVDGQMLRSRLKRTIPDVSDRIRFVTRQDRTGYVGLILAADVLLDPPHFVGVNTSYDAFMFGKALVTYPSDYHRGRYTLGCYRKMGIGDCVVENTVDYVDRAVDLAKDRDRRKKLESEIRRASDCLFEDVEAVREHERILRDLIDLARQSSP